MLLAFLTVIFFVVDTALFFDQNPVIPVKGASRNDWKADSFWHGGWGSSGVHKGIDIFAGKGTPALAAVSGLVLFKGQLTLGGNVLVIIDPQWRLHYYAHLDSASVAVGDWVPQGSVVGQIGNTGNAKGRPTHLHYSIMSLIPLPKLYSNHPEGWKRMFYLNPDSYLR